jgi:hypothetical protein
MKLRLMAEERPLGNDEPANRMVRRMGITLLQRHCQSRNTTMISAQPKVFFNNFRRTRALRWLLATAVLATFAAPGAADARRPPTVRAGAYDGTWNVVFATQAGNCSSTNSLPFAVSGTHLLSAGGGKVTGGISRNGVVAVRISVGLSAASGNGRLVGNSGAGRWSGVISGDRCSGSWQATRS